MRLLDGKFVFSATDLARFVRCAHVSTLDKADLTGTLVPLAPRCPGTRSSEVLSRRGAEHEESVLKEFESSGARVVRFDVSGWTSTDLSEGDVRTLAAMRDGVDYIYQAPLFDGRWAGYADFLQRVPEPSLLGPWSYEAMDAKLATSVRPHTLLQLCGYSEHLERLQGRAPTRMHAILGDGQTESFRFADLAALYRHLKSKFEARLSDDADSPTTPYPVEFCSLCAWRVHCYRDLVSQDHLSLVANIRRVQVTRLVRADIDTLTRLGELPVGRRVPEIGPQSVEALRHQASLQLHHRQTGRHRYDLLQPEEDRGLEWLPSPSDGDVFFDIEADPFVETGLTYLFGLAWKEDASAEYRCFWAHDAVQERRAFESVVDFLSERLARFPEMHVYHYGSADPSTLKRLMGRYGSREDEIDSFLRLELFVDLQTVVRQAMRISQPSYSLKKLEVFYFNREEEGVADAGGAILAYESWLESHDDEMLGAIERYNREDCVSALGLRSWLIGLRSEAEGRFGRPLSWASPPDPRERSPDAVQAELEADELSKCLIAGLPADAASRAGDEAVAWLLANLLHYHRREARPKWWWFFARQRMSIEELVEDGDSIGALSLDTNLFPRAEKKSMAFTYSFPPQSYKLAPADLGYDPATGENAGEILAISDAAGRLELKRGPKFDGTPHPLGLIPGGPLEDKTLRRSLRRFAAASLDEGFNGGRYRAAKAILRRELPRIRGISTGAPLHGDRVEIADVTDLVRKLDASYLFVQGPPGSGKTYTAAYTIVALLREGARVAVTANAHKAIQNLLSEVERVADEQGVRFRGLKKAGTEADQHYVSRLASPMVESCSKTADLLGRGVQLAAGTAWAFADPSFDEAFDFLFVDEAGQVSLANALVIAMAAKNVVLLGDPLQLAQVSQATHPTGSGASVLEHILGDAPTIPRERGVFLERTWRMHPDVCRFVSEIVYESRLESAEGRERQRVDAPGVPRLTGTGLRCIPLAHDANARDSQEEADRIAADIARMLPGGSVTDFEGKVRPLSQGDFMVVTPYNAQVRRIASTLRSRSLGGIEVGTVDKFQGRQAEVVFFSMATSSGADLPRDIDFLFSRNRLNVAISRARCLAVLVASPRLLDVTCRTPEQMVLVNALCRFVEMAARVDED